MVLFWCLSYTSVTYINIMEIQIYDKLLTIPNLFLRYILYSYWHLYMIMDIHKYTKNSRVYQIKKGEFLVSPFCLSFRCVNCCRFCFSEIMWSKNFKSSTIFKNYVSTRWTCSSINTSITTI